MGAKRKIVIVGGGTAGWLTAAYLAKALGAGEGGRVDITLLESPDIGIIGVGEGAFPTIRNTLRFLGVDEAEFIREAAATFKQGIRFVDWEREGARFFHPFEAPFFTEEADIVGHWLALDPATRPTFAEAVTIQNRVAEARRAPKRPHEDDFTGPLSYAYHFDAHKLSAVLADCARGLGVRHVEGRLTHVELRSDGAVDHLVTAAGDTFTADLFVDCSGFRAEIIGQALQSPFKSARPILFTDRAVTARVPRAPGEAIESLTVATAHPAGWTWDIGLNGMRGVGCVYSSAHMSDEDAEATLRAYLGAAGADVATRTIAFEAGYREKPWIRNCVAVGLSAGFLEPLEATGLVLIETAVGMIADLLPMSGPIDAPARRFNEVMTARYDNIIAFLKLHYCLSKRPEPFWRDNTDPASIPPRLADLLEQWRYRPPARFDFTLDLESFAFYNYQYILYGMNFGAEPAPEPEEEARVAERVLARIQKFGDQAAHDLPGHDELIAQINRTPQPSGQNSRMAGGPISRTSRLKGAPRRA
ncbi:MAG: tryptophan 7-halogenase [Brevundimonas sp.]|nr:MAG: tryptophan 7-halogenase [Brevundimonas sp.]